MTDQKFKMAEYLISEISILGDHIKYLNYCLSELSQEDRDITISVDQSPDINSIPIDKEVLVGIIKNSIEVKEFDAKRYRSEFEKLYIIKK